MSEKRLREIEFSAKQFLRETTPFSVRLLANDVLELAAFIQSQVSGERILVSVEEIKRAIDITEDDHYADDDALNEVYKLLRGWLSSSTSTSTTPETEK